MLCLVAVLSLACRGGQTVASGDFSVILIVADTLRADHLGLYGYDRPTSPNLDSWAAEGRVFEHAFAPAPWTLPSFASIYTGRWPLIHQGGRVGAPTRFSCRTFPPVAPAAACLLLFAGAGCRADNVMSWRI